MNRPLRLGGTTFFQSSYSENPDGSVSSTLTVVKNPARLFPYVASLLTFLGLAWHFSLALVRRSERKQERS